MKSIDTKPKLTSPVVFDNSKSFLLKRTPADVLLVGMLVWQSLGRWPCRALRVVSRHPHGGRLVERTTGLEMLTC
jgi:hypothetical protein